MTKKEIAKAIADEVGVTRAVVAEVVQRVLDGILDVLEIRGRIELRNFGVFAVRKRRARHRPNRPAGGPSA